MIDSTTIRCYNYTTKPTLTCSFQHGLKISGQTNIVATVGVDATVSISITSNQKKFKQSEIKWIGTNGSIEMESIHTTMEDLTLT